MSNPRIAVLLGDPSGVGPEMAVKLLARERNRQQADLLLIADGAALASGEAIAGQSLDVLRVEHLDAVRFEPGRITLLPCDGLGGQPPVLGESNEASGRASMRALDLAIDAVRAGRADAIVFAPLNKHSLRLGGLNQEDELRHLQERFGVHGFTSEFNLTGALWTSRVTSHIPLKDVAAHITGEGVCDAVRLIDKALRSAGIARPRIAVSGLNPHAGDGGSIGMEEIETIAPAVQRLRAEGLDARGPYSPDTVFIGARRGDVDAVVSMYHDQGQIAMKLMGFEKGVTLHGGLPVPVATSASGSAFDIAGRGIAQIEGLQEAFDLCVRMAAR
ncbi:4-hydroxythreonine-4-phosphate dehydrogenase PdxA [Pseudorhodoferax sp. Leaf274]|uniref:4-hydroxythreonine-4-phosphate dehydrogenase PdxA n=1 Tax=Pseudorhodoferax sp. Leaf274 TaxID=1736318 RepID=UPI000702507A|nr:4-hydroxythreonine-4-phosphate dehydrogenase PdxA [Pseudorhodoferax sp. Leaf274]KQP41596.1 4-hydroxythreonine-4-phosphate dehydrogenase [Pseudorhodoferax sp. Leaf274]